MQCQKIAEKLKQNLPSVSTERREAQPLREERDPFTFLRIAALNIREAREDLKYIGCYHACRENDMSLMYRAVRQDVRMQYAGIMGGSELWSMALIALSGNDHELFQIMFPANFKYSNRKNILHRVMNRLLIALYYGEEKSGREAIRDAEAFLRQKHPQAELLTVRYLCALWNSKTDCLPSLLTDICAAGRRSSFLLEEFADSTNTALEKTVSFFAHGLFALAQHCLSPEEFQNIPLPEDRGFLKEYEEYRRTAFSSVDAEGSAEPFIRFSGDAAWLNEVPDALPKTVLRADTDGDIFIDYEDHYEKLFTHLLHSPSFQKMYQNRDVCWAAKWDTFDHFLNQYHAGDEKKRFYGRGLLYYALANPDLNARYRVSHFLLEHGAEVLPLEKEFDGPFHYLFRQKYHDIPRTKALCEELLRHGADPNQAGTRNLLPVDDMIRMQYSEEELKPLYDLWLSLPDLELNLRTFGGRRPIDLAREYGRKELAGRLEKRMEHISATGS